MFVTSGVSSAKRKYVDCRQPMIDLELFVFSQPKFLRLTLHCIIACMSFSSEMSKKITVDPVLRLLESNHDFCVTIKRSSHHYRIMHQSIPSTNIPPPPGFCTLLLPRGRDLYLMTFPRGRVFAYP